MQVRLDLYLLILNTLGKKTSTAEEIERAGLDHE